MKKKTRFALWAAVALLALLTDIDAQQTAPAPPPTRPNFRASVDLVTSDVVVRSRRGQFQADLSRDDFELFEDGVKQDVSSFVLVHGGRAYSTQVAVAAPVREGIILPPSRPTNDAAGRIIVFVVDDLHLDFRDTPRVRSLFKKLGQQLVHEGDLFGIVSTGTSSIAIDLTYDRTRLDEAANRITGGGLKPTEIIQAAGSSGDTPPEVTYRANVAFSTMTDFLTRLEQTHNRRKAVVLLSNGYDFDPFAAARAGKAGNQFENNHAMEAAQDTSSDPNSTSSSSSSNSDPNNMNGRNQFADTELAIELNELGKQANRANATFYTIDPRGLVAGQDLDDQVDPNEWETHLRKSQDSLRVLAEQTGGLAVVNTNDFDKALRRIDAETSDYYVLGYYSSNPDPTQRRRVVEIRVKKPDPEGGNFDLTYRHEYTLKPLPTAQKPK